MNDVNFEPWERGESITARKLNQSGSAVAAALATVTGSQAGSSPNAVPFPVTIVSIQDDYLVCRPLNVESAGDDIFVAKPWGLRKTPFHGLTMPNQDGTLMSYDYTSTQARTVTDESDSSTEDQVIVPAYVPAQTAAIPDPDGGADIPTAFTGSEITVQRVAFGPTASFTRDGSGGTITVEIEWEDMNRDGRAWAEDNGS